MSSHNGSANATAVGFAALATASFVFFAFLTQMLPKIMAGAIPATMAGSMIPWLVASGIVLVIVGIINIVNNDVVLGTTFFVSGAFFMLGVALSTWLQASAKIVPAFDGIAFIALALILILLTPAFAAISWLLFVALIIADIGVILITLVQLAILGPLFSIIAGWFILVLGLISLYLVLAIVYNSAVGSSAISIGGPLIKKKE